MPWFSVTEVKLKDVKSFEISRDAFGELFYIGFNVAVVTSKFCLIGSLF